VAPLNGRIQYYMTADSALHANITCQQGYHIEPGSSQHILHCTGVIWSSGLPACTPGMIDQHYSSGGYL